MHNFLELPYAIQLAITFVTLVTGAWKKSYSTALFVLTSLIPFYYITICSEDIAMYLVNLVSFGLVLRAMLQPCKDTFIRGERCV